MELGKYSFGTGDRFGHQGKAQLRALLKAPAAGIHITPVWNKSNREHMYIQTKPEDTRLEADRTVKSEGYKGAYFVDADHINLGNVHGFIPFSDFFTLDIASRIGTVSTEEETREFIFSCRNYSGELNIPGIMHPFLIDDILLKSIADKFLSAINEAGKIYRYIISEKGTDNFITEVSMDEVEMPQTPVELFFILKMIADQNIPARTIAPKFTGRFNKGVDYQGDPLKFAQEFEEDILVIDFAIKEFNLPPGLKLSVHSGSDKFSIYPVMGEIIRKYDKGIHLKTAGTTWLEEVTGLALAGGEGLEMAKKIYKKAYIRQQELCLPYADVIDISKENLPLPEEVEEWDSIKYSNTLRHIPGHPDYNADFRQLIHIAYKVAAEYGKSFTDLLDKYSDIVGACVEENIYERHLKRLFNL